jgi:uncharacterized protein YfkK (UPF0435 family)
MAKQSKAAREFDLKRKENLYKLHRMYVMSTRKEFFRVAYMNAVSRELKRLKDGK